MCVEFEFEAGCVEFEACCVEFEACSVLSLKRLC